MTRSLTLAALLLTPLAVLQAAETSPIQISDHTVIFKHISTDPKDPANTSGFNQGPSITAVPDGRVMAVWFSSPSEGAEAQRIMQAFSADQGQTWDEATVLQDFAGQADFDLALFVAGKERFPFFSAFRPQIVIYFRRSSDAAFTLVTRSPKLHAQSILTACWRLTRWSDGQTELYDHDSDPEEFHDVSAQHADVMTKLSVQLQKLPALSR